MKLFLIERLDNIGYDEYDAHIVAAKDTDSVLEGLPYGDEGLWSTLPVKVTLIGTAARGTKAGVILSSFCAG